MKQASTEKKHSKAYETLQFTHFSILQKAALHWDQPDKHERMKAWVMLKISPSECYRSLPEAASSLASTFQCGPPCQVRIRLSSALPAGPTAAPSEVILLDTTGLDERPTYLAWFTPSAAQLQVIAAESLFSSFFFSAAKRVTPAAPLLQTDCAIIRYEQHGRTEYSVLVCESLLLRREQSRDDLLETL